MALTTSAEGAAVEHLAGGGDQRARGAELLWYARWLARLITGTDTASEHAEIGRVAALVR